MFLCQLQFVLRPSWQALSAGMVRAGRALPWHLGIRTQCCARSSFGYAGTACPGLHLGSLPEKHPPP